MHREESGKSIITVQVPNEESIESAYRQGEDSVKKLITELINIVQTLSKHIQDQAETIQRLQDQLSKNSGNSSKPPSGDCYKKKPYRISLRKSGERQNGGQKGHQGATLRQVENPDIIKVHTVAECCNCHASLKDVKSFTHEKRQLFEIPAIRVEVTEHQSEIKICPYCGARNKAEFPEELSQPVQYGSRLKSHASYFNNYQFIPLQRTCEIFKDLYGCPISEAAILKANTDLSKHLQPSIESIKKQIIKSGVIHADESGFRVNNKLHWLHSNSTSLFTYYGIHKKRGKEAMDAIGILPGFKKTVVHDHWKPYFKYDHFQHALCNAHHLRELKFITEQYRQPWSEDMANLLLEIKAEIEVAVKNKHAENLSSKQIAGFEERYDKIIEKGFSANPPPEIRQASGKRGRIKRSPPINLLNRLKNYKKETLAFMYDFNVPFDNNQGERDIRMVKVKQKVSGTMRTIEGAEVFCNIRGYISTIRKNSLSVINAIQDAFNGKPFIPDLNKS
ncbi:MAG: IS66 family transposase [Candidatus Desulfaltia sp.]|nr:IS66 family transposase [Candidatus Desulfaltia sp.]